MTKEQPVSHTVNQRVSAPFAKKDLVDFLATVPDEADINVITINGGTQRDPVPSAYGFSASW